MKILAVLSIFALVACSSVPSKPPTPATCTNLTPCAPLVAGIPADKTVMLMVQSPMLIAGKAADPTEWPASVYAKAGNSACSATLVGDRVLFIASHCVSDGGQVTFSAHSNSYKATCSHHPEYRGNSTADWALCLVDRPVTGVPFEVMGINQMLSLDQELLLSGYGCVKPGGGGGNDGIFRIGNAKIWGLPIAKTYDIVTKGGSALCFGDSGGAAYVVSATGPRWVVAVNSRGDISTTSYLPAVSSGAFVSWASTWAKSRNNVRICGLHEDAMGCRTGESKPLPDGRFEVRSAAACVKGIVSPAYLSRKEEIVSGVRQTLEKF